ncbi:MAG: sugar phosphate isomerase/epimerase [Clostridia bacterium]|nr:sugar phosphate isomerase/epimerase [Clostridia bacterium]
MKIGIQSGSSVREIGAEKAYRLFAEAGFETIDWNINDGLPGKLINSVTYQGNIYEKSVDEIMEYFSYEYEQIRKNGLEITQAHAPFPAYAQGKPETLDYMIEVYKKCILFCDRVGCKNLIIHGITLTKKDRENSPESVRAMNDKLYESLIPTLLLTDVTVCLENLFAGAGGIISGVCSDPYEAVEMIDRYNGMAGKECFGLCLDTGHLNLLKLDMRYYIPILGRRIKALHIHDNDGITDQHKAPYTGTIVWKDFYTELNRIGFDGDLSFETFHQTSIADVDEELILPWLKLICTIGKHFKNKIEGN